MEGRQINNLIYAGDTALLAESKEELLKLVANVKEKSSQARLYLNLKKATRCLLIEEFVSDGEKVE